MNAVQMLTGRGGWPMSVFLTPDLKPFYGGTYWPPTGRARHAGLRSDSRGGDRRLEESPRAGARRRPTSSRPSCKTSAQRPAATRASSALDLIDAAVGQLAASVRSAPTAASARRRNFRTRWICNCCCASPIAPASSGPLDMVRLTLDRMAAGGIYDHLGGGFARYSVDARWLVPHFEKMLYDNALLAGAYLGCVSGHAATRTTPAWSAKRSTTCSAT